MVLAEIFDPKYRASRGRGRPATGKSSSSRRRFGRINTNSRALCLIGYCAPPSLRNLWHVNKQQSYT